MECHGNGNGIKVDNAKYHYYSTKQNLFNLQMSSNDESNEVTELPQQEEKAKSNINTLYFHIFKIAI